jgi:hypothetical protein
MNITINDSLEGGEEYTLSFDGMADVVGSGFEGEISFTVAPMMIMTTVPADGEADVSVDGDIVLSFDYPVDPSSFDKSMIEITGLDQDDFEAELTMAQNERESFQILMRADQNFIIRSVIFSDLKSAGGNIIKGENLSYGFVEYEYLSRNSKETEEKAWVRKAPGYFPDPISNSRSISVNPKVTQPIWVTLYTPKDTIPDTYEGEIKINTSLGEFFVNIKAEVCPVIIPDACESKFKFIIWQQILSTTIYREYGYKKYTKEWWEVVSDIADKMAENRINDLYVNTQNLLLDGGTYIDENGNYVFNWSKFTHS